MFPIHVKVIITVYEYDAVHKGSVDLVANVLN